MKVNKKIRKIKKKLNYNVMEKQFQYKKEKWCRYDWKEKIIKNQKNKNEFKYHMMFKNVIKKIEK